MRTAIAIAAGGGGDAITAAMLAAAMAELGIAAIMSYSWDRFMIDPAPGPRERADFEVSSIAAASRRSRRQRLCGGASRRCPGSRAISPTRVGVC
ncbi:DUF1152 domain-containing protein [Nocardia sp. NPDC059239]|uniref:DUF1152 domain-containing protein n=1 Tax=unclassified Nocardia TaxID=2637762 RepID=UPI0036745C60